MESSYKQRKAESRKALGIQTQCIGEVAHSDIITSVSVSNDSRYIVSGSRDKTIGILDIDEKKLLHRFEQAHSGVITSVTFTSDNKYIISGSEDKTIGIWDIAYKRLLHRFDRAHSQEITSVTITSDNKYIVSGSRDMTIAIWDIADKKLFHRLEQAHSEIITSLAVISDSRYIVSGSRDTTIGIWDIVDKRLIYRFEQAHSHEITSLAVTSDNKYIVTGSLDMTIGIWDIAEKRLLHRFEQAYSQEILSIAVMGDSRYIVSGSRDMTIGIWDIADKRLLHRFEQAHSQEITSLAVTRDNKYIVSGSFDGTIRLWSFEGIIGFSDKLTSFLMINNSFCKLSPENPFEKDFFSQFSRITCLRQRWNALNFIIFLLPSSASLSNIDLAIENNVHLTFDKYHMTQLDYLLEYDGDRSAQTDEFFFYFFKNLPFFLDFKSIDRDQILISITRATFLVYEKFGEAFFLALFNSLHSKQVRQLIQKDLQDNLLSVGQIKNSQAKEIFPFEGLLGENEIAEINSE